MTNQAKTIRQAKALLRMFEANRRAVVTKNSGVIRMARAIVKVCR